MQAICKTTATPGCELNEVDTPEPGPRDALIRIEAASVCGTDLDIVNNWESAAATWGSQLPMILGHECSGVVEMIGNEVTEVAVGDVVVVETHIFCGECAACRADARHNCLEMAIPGVSRDGIFADRAVIPARSLYVVEPGVDPGLAALYEAAGVAAHAVERAGDVRDRTIAVTGAGPVGLFLVSQLKSLGAAHVAVLEPSDARRERAADLGATVFGLGGEPEFTAFCRDHGAVQGADIGFDVSGAVPAYSLLFDSLGKDSSLVSVGHMAEPLPVNISRDVNLRVIDWKGTFGRRIWSSWHQVDRMVRSGDLDLSAFVVDELKLHEVPDRLDEIATKPGKVLVRP